jgi:hypothetical protein
MLTVMVLEMNSAWRAIPRAESQIKNAPRFLHVVRWYCSEIPEIRGTVYLTSLIGMEISKLSPDFREGLLLRELMCAARTAAKAGGRVKTAMTASPGRAETPKNCLNGGKSAMYILSRLAGW